MFSQTTVGGNPTKISVIGATGMVGAEIVAEAQARGHEVSAYTRSGSQGN